MELVHMHVQCIVDDWTEQSMMMTVFDCGNALQCIVDDWTVGMTIKADLQYSVIYVMLHDAGIGLCNASKNIVNGFNCANVG